MGAIGIEYMTMSGRKLKRVYAYNTTPEDKIEYFLRNPRTDQKDVEFTVWAKDTTEFEVVKWTDGPNP